MAAILERHKRLMAAAHGFFKTISVRTGEIPINCAAVDSGETLGSATIPATWSFDAIPFPAVVEKTGIATHFRIYGSDGRCHAQGSMSDIGLPDSVELVAMETVMIPPFSVIDQ